MMMKTTHSSREYLANLDVCLSLKQQFVTHPTIQASLALLKVQLPTMHWPGTVLLCTVTLITVLLSLQPNITDHNGATIGQMIGALHCKQHLLMMHHLHACQLARMHTASPTGYSNARLHSNLLVG
jgi:hypothetical protein